MFKLMYINILLIYKPTLKTRKPTLFISLNAYFHLKRTQYVAKLATFYTITTHQAVTTCATIVTTFPHHHLISLSHSIENATKTANHSPYICNMFCNTTCNISQCLHSETRRQKEAAIFVTHPGILITTAKTESVFPPQEDPRHPVAAKTAVKIYTELARIKNNYVYLRKIPVEKKLIPAI